MLYTRLPSAAAAEIRLAGTILGTIESRAGRAKAESAAETLASTKITAMLGLDRSAFSISRAATSASALSAIRTSERRSNRSARFPPTNAISSIGTNSATPTRPTIAEECVSW